MNAEVSTHTFLTMIIEESVCFMSCEPFFFGCNYSYVVPTEYIFTCIRIFVINWTVLMSDNLPERVQILGHAHIIYITVRENRILCCQIFCELLLKSAFERIFNVMQLILVKIKWHIKWKYLIQKFHDICLSYYFNKKRYFLRTETREKINRQYTYIVENIKFIYTSFDEFFLPVSQRVEMNYIFSDNIRILYLLWYVKSPKEIV
jgi:hypothetical protein